MSLSVPERKKYITNRLIQLGYTPIQTAAIVGNLQQENSTFDPTLKNSIGATGIAQWLSKGRKDVLLQKDNPYSIDTQLEFLHEEIQGKTKDAWTNNVGGREAFMNAKTVEEATLIFRKDYERPGEHEAYDNNRIKYASEAMGLIDPNYQPPQFTNQVEQGITPTPIIEELNRISPADIWEMYKDEPSKAAELIAFKNEYEERLKKEAQEEKQAEVDLQKQALAQAQAENQMVKNLLTTPTTPQEEYNAQIAQPQQPEQPFRFQTDWYIPQMAQEGGTITDTISGNTNDEKVLEHIEDIILPAVKLTGKAPEWVQYRREFEKNNPKGPYLYDNRSMWTNEQILSDKYEREANQYIYDQLLKNNPRRSGESRGEYIQRIAGDNPIVQDIIEQNKNRDSSTSENIYSNFARGYLGLSINPLNKKVKTAYEDNFYAPYEREQITNSPLENIGNMADILSVPYNATMGTLYTRGQGQDNYNMASGLSGRVPENRNTMLEIFGDPLNLVGVGAVSKTNASRKAIQQLGKYATENTPLRNTYLLNPNAVKSWGNMGESPHWLKGYREGWNPENIEDIKKLDSFLQSSFDKGRSNQSPIGKLHIKRENNKITREEFIKKADKIYGVKDSPIESYANPRGSGTYGQVYKIRNSDEVIKRMIKGDDYIQDFDKLVEKGNRLQSELGDRVSFVKKSIVGESEVFKGKKDVTTIMRDLKPKGESINMLSALKGEGNIKDSAWKTLKEDIKKLNDNGLYVDLNNYDNIVYDVDKGKFIIFDINDTRNILSGEGGNFKGGLTKELAEKLNNLLPKQEAYTYQQGGTISPLQRIKQKFQQI